MLVIIGATTEACMGYLVQEIRMNIFKCSATSLGHDEEQYRRIDDGQAAKKKIWPAVGTCEENWNDQNDTEVYRLSTHQHLTLVSEI